jgi:glycosyltransferase involved in cell wall biosynthesis
MAIVEAMACGKAVVVSDLGGARELFEEGKTAIGHRPGDVVQLAEKIAFLAQNASLRARLGKQAAAAARSRFHESEMAANFRRVYESVIDGTAAAA